MHTTKHDMGDGLAGGREGNGKEGCHRAYRYEDNCHNDTSVAASD